MGRIGNQLGLLQRIVLFEEEAKGPCLIPQNELLMSAFRGESRETFGVEKQSSRNS